MRIAYICADFGIPIFGFKGASVHVREMVSNFEALGHEVVVLSPSVERVGNETAVIHVIAIDHSAAFLQTLEEMKPLDALLGRSNRFRQDIRNLHYNTVLMEEAYPLLVENGIDLIYERYTLFNYAGIALARKLGVPHILEVNAPLCYEKEKVSGIDIKPLAYELEQRIFCETDHLIVVSSQLQRYAESLGVPAERIQVLPNGVTLEKFGAVQPQQVRQQWGLVNRDVIGFVGSLKPWHGTETLVSAYADLWGDMPNAHLLLVGDGPERPFLTEQIAAAGLQQHVTFTGKVPHAEVPSYAAAMDIAVAPYTPHDNFYFSPMKIFEYMAAGTAVIAAAIGQVAESIQHGQTGLLYEPGNIAELRGCLRQLLQDPPLRQRLGAAGRAWVQQNQTWQRNATTILTIAKQLQAA